MDIYSHGIHGDWLTLAFRDIDQIKADLLSSRHLAQFIGTKVVEDLPGLGRNYCIQCAKWFDTESALNAHRRGKPHKRRFVFSLLCGMYILPTLTIC